jgi:hypothetical protein
MGGEVKNSTSPTESRNSELLKTWVGGWDGTEGDNFFLSFGVYSPQFLTTSNPSRNAGGAK